MTATVTLDSEATAADLSELGVQYASALADLPWEMRRRRAAGDAAALRALATDWARLTADPGSDDDRLTVAEWRAELGMCPDGDPHFAGPGMCRAHECPTWRQAEYDDHVAETGRLR